MAEIDTAAPFASVRDAVNMFGERSPVKTQRIFPTVNTVNAEKIISLETELRQAREELVTMQKQLAIAESTAADALKELAETKFLLEESKKEAENIASVDSSWQVQLEAALEQQAGTTSEIESGRKEISRLQAELEDLKAQHANTLTALTRAEEDNDRLKEEMVEETNALTEKQEQEAKEQANLVAQRVDELIKDLYATNDLLAKADVAREGAEKELLINREAESQRLKSAASTAAVEVEKLRSELKDAEEKQEQIIAAVEKLKIKLTATQEAEKRAIRAESDANLKLQRMKIDVEDAKVATEKARTMAIQLEESNAKLKNAAEQERSLLASLASLKAELKNTSTELMNMKMEAEDSSAEMEEQLTQLQADLEAAIAGEAKAKEFVCGGNNALQQVSAEAEEAKSAAAQAKQEAAQKKQELEQALAHSNTLESRLQAAIKETEAARASEAFALTEVKSFKERVSGNTEVKTDGTEVTISYDEYETVKKKVIDADDVANKRVTAALAQAHAAKAGELEMLSRMEAAKHLIDLSQAAMKQAIQRAEAAEAAKSAVEGELRKWRSESEQRRKDAVAAVIQAVGSNGAEQKRSPVANGEGPFYRKGVSPYTESNGVSQIKSPGTPQSRESLAQVLQYNYLMDEKAKKNMFSKKLGSYFNKKVK